jgi:hypothetical protein
MKYCNYEKQCKYKETLSSEYPDGDQKCNKCDWCLYQEYIEENEAIMK